jgi:hypothetical protein
LGKVKTIFYSFDHMTNGTSFEDDKKGEKMFFDLTAAWLKHLMDEPVAPVFMFDNGYAVVAIRLQGLLRVEMSSDSPGTMAFAIKAAVHNHKVAKQIESACKDADNPFGFIAPHAST